MHVTLQYHRLRQGIFVVMQPFLNTLYSLPCKKSGYKIARIFKCKFSNYVMQGFRKKQLFTLQYRRLRRGNCCSARYRLANTQTYNLFGVKYFGFPHKKRSQYASTALYSIDYA